MKAGQRARRVLVLCAIVCQPCFLPTAAHPQALAREPNTAVNNAKGGKGRSDTGGAAGARGSGGGEPSRTPRAILAESWREDADLGEVVWALVQVFGPGFLARLPQPGRLPSMTI